MGELDQPVTVLTTLGAVLLSGLAMEAIGRRTRLPRVTMLLLFGFAVGPVGLDLLPDPGELWFSLIADMALVMIGFLLGERLTLPYLRRHGRLVLWFSVAQALGTAVAVFAGLWLMGVPPALALLLAGIAPATDPAATTEVARELGAEGPFTRVLLGVVAVDDAWGLIIFVVLVAAAGLLAGQGSPAEVLALGAWDLGGALILGFGLGVPAAYLTGRLQPGEPTLLEAAGLIFLCGGLALWLHVSFLLAAMALGACVANLARHHEYPFHAIEGIEWPFLVLFFVFAGASLQVSALAGIGLAGAGYIAFRILGRVIGSWLGGVLSGAERPARRWMGFALMPQAGVALGMALMAAGRFPELSDAIMSIAIGSTVLFELLGPIATRMALVRTGEASGKRLAEAAPASQRRP